MTMAVTGKIAIVILSIHDDDDEEEGEEEGGRKRLDELKV